MDANANASNDVLKHIREYVEQSRRQDAERMEIDDALSSRIVETRLTATIKELEQRVQRRRAELEQLRARTQSSSSLVPSGDPKERLKQLEIIQSAYERMQSEQPFLPAPGSALPSLLAARSLQGTINETKKSIETTQSQLETAQRQIPREEGQLSDAKMLGEALNIRTARLQKSQYDDPKTSIEKAKEAIRVKSARRKAFQQDTENLRQVLNTFIDEHLAAMLAAEEIGGPVVGVLADVNEDMLTAGFSTQGKLKPAKPETSTSEAKRQRRIDDIWGHAEKQHASEKDAAMEEIRGLLGDLIESGTYVQLDRDSAVARFLVRAKVAQFHPKDARRIRLIHFGRGLDD